MSITNKQHWAVKYKTQYTQTTYQNTWMYNWKQVIHLVVFEIIWKINIFRILTKIVWLKVAIFAQTKEGFLK